MIEVKDTTELRIKGLDKQNKKFTKQNLLFFKTRCRSRSFYEISPLNKKEKVEDQEVKDENSYGYSLMGVKYQFLPKPYEINKKYEEVKKLFEDTLSPTIVHLTKCQETETVSIYDCI